MRLRIFLIAAIVLIVFGIIAGAATTLTLFSVQWFIWFMAAFLAYLVDHAFGGWGYANGAWGRDAAGNPVPPA